MIPHGNTVLIETLIQDKTVGGIHIPDNIADKPTGFAKVLKLGTGKVDSKGRRTEFEVAEGDKILFSKYSGFEVAKNQRILDCREILAVIG